MKMFRKLVSIVAAATLLTSSLAFSFSASAAQVDDTAAVSSEPNLQAKAEDGVILHAFNWSYNSIKQNLPQIAAAGYSTVQTSPVTQPKNYGTSSDVANQWWKLYQPVSLSIAQSSWLGTKDDLKSLCAEADKYGIKIIVDIVANHMANYVDSTGKDVADKLGDEVKTYELALYNSYSTYFHSETYTASDSSATSVTRGHVSACPDLNTANSTVQTKIYNLLVECIDCGVDGFRFDAAKHIETETDSSVGSQFWVNTLDKAKTYYKNKTGNDLFAYGEILNTVGSGRNLSSYTKRMRVTDNKSSDNVLVGVNNGSTTQASASNYQLGAGASNSVLWAESHDTYMGESGSAGLSNTAGVSDEKIVKAWAIVASRANATALYFARPGSALMGEAAGDLTYKSTVVSEINKFHNAFANVSSEKVGSSGNMVYVARGNSGIVISNLNGTTASASISGTGLADGSYVDTVTGNTFTVSGGTLKGNIGSTGVAVVYKSTSTPKATASVESGNFTDDTMTVQLALENAVSGTYALENSTPVSFTGTPTIRIGSDYKVGETITLNLTATDAAGQTSTSTYYYTKKAPTASGIYVFLKPSIAKQWTNVCCYVYDEDTSSTTDYVVAGWPGKAMTYDETLGYWYIEVPATCLEKLKTSNTTKESNFDLPNSSNTYVIFNGTRNGVTTQYPASNAVANQKIKLGGKSHVLDAANVSSWKVTTMTPTKTEVQATDVTKGDQQQTTAQPTTEAPTTEEPTVPDETKFVQKGIYGDVDLDGKITVTDVSVLQRHLSEYEPQLTGLAKILADVDKDGDLTVKDVTYIQIFLAEYSDNYAHTNEPYGEYIPVDPTGETFTVTAKSNLFAEKSAKFDKDTETLTVTYFMNSEKDLLGTDWLLTYDGTALQPVGTSNFMPKVSGAVYNTKPESAQYGITGNASVLSLVPMQTTDGKAVPFVSVTFKVLKAESSVVNLDVKDLNVSKLNAGESTSKEANETDIVENGEVKKPDSKYTLYTSVYTGSLNENYDYTKDPKVEYDPSTPQPISTEPTTVEPTTDPIPAGTRTILFTDNKGWGSVNIHYWGSASGDTEWPGVPMTDAGTNGYGEKQFSFEIPTDVEGMVFNGESGQTVDVVYDSVSTGWYPTDEQDELGHWYVDSWISDDPDEPTKPIPDPDGDTRRIEFTDNQGWGSVNIYIYGPNGEAAVWPGAGMNKKGDNGYGGTNYWYDVPTDTEFIIFSGGGQQTVDVPYDNTSTGWYPTQMNGEGKWEVDSWISDDPDNPDNPIGGTRNILFTDNKGWGTVYVHYWGSESGDTEWPGVAMTSAGTNDFGQAQYSYNIPTDVEGMVFNNGNGDQTANVYYDNTSTGWYPLDTKDSEGHWEVGNWTDGNSDDDNPISGNGDYYLIGYIDGADYGDGEDYANFGDYKFVNGQVTVTFNEDSYVCIKSSDMVWYMTNGFLGEVTSATLYNTSITGEKSDKLMVPAGTHTFTLVANSDGTFTLSYGEGGDTPTNPPTPVGTRTILFTDGKGWGSVNIHYWGSASGDTEWPGVAMTPAGTNDYGQAQFSFDIPTDVEGMVFNGASGQTVDVTYDSNVTGWYPLDTTDAEGHYEVGSWTDGEEQPTNPVSNNKTINVGIIYYLSQSGHTVHWWDNDGNSGDADLTSTGSTANQSVGSSYWGGAAQSFNMYTAEIPNTATGFKVHSGDTWYGSDASSSNSSAYVFEYGGNYLAYYK